MGKKKQGWMFTLIADCVESQYQGPVIDGVLTSTTEIERNRRRCQHWSHDAVLLSSHAPTRLAAGAV